MHRTPSPRLAYRLALAAAVAAAVFAGQPMHAAPITGLVYVQPINVCNGSLTVCGDATRTIYTAATETIWAQAGLQIDFLTWNAVGYVDTDNLLTLGSGNSADDSSAFTTAAIGPQYINGVPVISMWFVPSIYYCGGPTNGTIMGCTGGGDVFISDAVFSTNRIDTIAHELGHSLGLYHCGASGLCDSTPADDLMAAGTYPRSVPTSIDDIAPAGLKYDQLSPAEIAVARQSDFVFHTPEPASFALAAIGGLFLLRRRPAA
jgi:MYXO-CTERM domain-containing protein